MPTARAQPDLVRAVRQLRYKQPWRYWRKDNEQPTEYVDADAGQLQACRSDRVRVREGCRCVDGAIGRRLRRGMRQAVFRVLHCY